MGGQKYQNRDMASAASRWDIGQRSMPHMSAARLVLRVKVSFGEAPRVRAELMYHARHGTSPSGLSGRRLSRQEEGKGREEEQKEERRGKRPREPSFVVPEEGKGEERRGG